MRILPVLALAAILAGCSAQQITDTQTKIESGIANAGPTIQVACWGVDAADALFQALYVAGKNADPAVVADEKKALAGAHAVCANPPANLASAVAAVMASVKAIQNVTPAQVAAAP